MKKVFNQFFLQLEAQKIVSSLMVVSGFVAGFITSLLLIFLGPWSDKSGRRKPLIILPICGMFFTSLFMLIVQAFPKLSTKWVVLAEILPLALGGNFTMLIMAGFNYLGDVSLSVFFFRLRSSKIFHCVSRR